MKRIGNLYEKIISLDNLRLADQKARRGKLRSHGVRVHDRNREANLLALHEALLTKSYHTSQYDVFKVYDPKEREIYRLPYYPDRIVHHAVMNVLEPIWTKVFTYNTYSCIKGRGIEGCARRVGTLIKRYEDKPLYCLKIDIKKFYPSIDHTVLKNIVRKKIKDKDLLWLLDEIIDSAEGLPIGNYLSQFLANLCLAYFMHWVNEELPDIVRWELGLEQRPCLYSVEYADDIPFLSDRKDVLHVIRRLVNNYLTFQVRPKSLQAWQHVFVLCQLHLRLGIGRLCTHGKDVKDKRCTVQYLHFQLRLDVTDLFGRKFVIEDNHTYFPFRLLFVLDILFYFVQLTLPDIRHRVSLIQFLCKPFHHFRPGCLSQESQFVQILIRLPLVLRFRNESHQHRSFYLRIGNYKFFHCHCRYFLHPIFHIGGKYKDLLGINIERS